MVIIEADDIQIQRLITNLITNGIIMHVSLSDSQCSHSPWNNHLQEMPSMSVSVNFFIVATELEARKIHCDHDRHEYPKHCLIETNCPRSYVSCSPGYSLMFSCGVRGTGKP